jgi:hypothetical protein
MVHEDGLYIIDRRVPTPTVEHDHEGNEEKKGSGMSLGDFEPDHTHKLNAPELIYGGEFLTTDTSCMFPISSGSRVHLDLNLGDIPS